MRPSGHHRIGVSTRRVGLIARNTLREASRQKLLLALAVLAAGFVLGAHWLREFHFGSSELKFIADCGLGAMSVFGALLVIAATAQLFFSELEHRTALTLLAKPVSAADFMLGKLLGLAALAGAYCVFIAALLAAVLWLRETELLRSFPDDFTAKRTIAYGNLAVAAFLHWCKLTVLAAFGLLIASFARGALFAVVLSSFVYAAAQLKHIAEEAAPRLVAGSVRTVTFICARLVPDFQVFALADSLTGAVMPEDVVRAVGYAVCYAAAAAGLSVVGFRHREL